MLQCVPGRGRTKSGWLWVLARDDRAWGGPDPPGVVYFYAPGRGREHAEKFLDGFDGILQVDGYAVTRMATTATHCVAIRCSSWLSTGPRKAAATCVPSPP